MPDIYSSGPGYVVYDLVLSGAESTQLSPDESTIYVAMASGEILVYDLASQALLQTINVAASLGSMTLSDDGAKAYVIGKATTDGPAAIYEVNLASGISSVLPNTQALAPTDIEYIDGNRLLVSGGQSWFYNLATQTASAPTGGNPVGFADPTIMVESDGLVLIAQTATSNGPLELYDETTGTVIGVGDSNQGGSPSGFNYGLQAVTREGGLVAQGIYPEHLEIYDLNLKWVQSIAYFGSYGGGLAFSSDGDFLLAYRAGPTGGTIAAFNTDSWISQLIVDLRPTGSWYFDGGNGDAITVTSDDSYIIVTDMLSGFVQIVQLTSPIGSNNDVVGSNNDDDLEAVMGQNVDGRDGVDTLSIDFSGAAAGVTADFRALAVTPSITIEGGTIVNVEIIKLIEGSEFDDVLGAYQQFTNTDAVINGNGGNDTIYVTLAAGIFGPQVDGGAGDDFIDGRGHIQGGDYRGGTGNDTIYTDYSTSAVAIGGEGDDILHSWGQAVGEEGNDTIVMHDPLDVTGAWPYAIGGAGNDTISAAAGSTDTHQYAGGAGADILTGGDGNDYLTSADFNGLGLSDWDAGVEQDQLFGGNGGDHLFAGYGDSADGGAQGDVLQLSLVGSPQGITLNTSSLTSATPFVFGGGTIQNVEYVERLYLTNLADTVTVAVESVLPQGRIAVFGNGGDDVVTDTGTYVDFIGGDGNDRFVAVNGQDSFVGEGGIDTIDYSLFGQGVAVNLNLGTGPDSTTVSSVENIDGTAFADELTGNSDDNIIQGFADNDALAGLGGVDTLLGGAGDDLLDGGAGNDTLTGGDGIDMATYVSAGSGVTVNLSITISQSTGQGADILTGIEHLEGSNFNDFLTGNGDANTIYGLDGNDDLNGGAGDDTLVGGAGDDIYRIDSLGDTLVEQAGGGSDTLYTPFSTYLGSYSNLEHLVLQAGAGGIFGVGTGEANSISGNEGANLIIGGAGNDLLSGLNGGDSLFGEDGSDSIGGGDGIDYLVGGAGDDELDGGGDADALYGEDGEDTLHGGLDFVTDILVGGAGNDTLFANSGLNDYDLIDGGAGDDAYFVDTGDDLTFEAADGGTDTVYADVSNVPNAGVYLYANVENLTLIGTTAFGVGNELANVLTGSASGNWLLGGAGNDTINGKAGDDVLFGEAGSDIFVFEAGSGADVIGDFNAAEDQLNLSAYNFASFAVLQANFVQVGNDGAIDLGGGNLIVLHGVTMASLDAGDFVL